MRLEHLLSGEDLDLRFLCTAFVCIELYREKDEAESNTDEVELNPKS